MTTDELARALNELAADQDDLARRAQDGENHDAVILHRRGGAQLRALADGFDRGGSHPAVEEIARAVPLT